MNEKAQIGSLQSIIITLVIIGIIIGIGLLVLEEFQDTLSEDKATVVNETLTPTDAGVYVTYNYTTPGIDCYNSFTVTQVLNASTDTIIASGNYSYDSNGKIWNLTSEFVNDAWNVTYTYQYGEEACAGVTSTITATQKIPTWLSIVVILLIVGILMFILFKTIAGTSSIGGFRLTGPDEGVAEI